MAVASDHVEDGGETFDPDGPRAVGGRSIAELTIGIPSPAIDRAVGAKRARMELTYGEPAGAKRRDRRRSGSAALAPVAELSMVVLSPARDLARRRAGAGVSTASAELGDAREPLHRHRDRAVAAGDAELAVAVRAPTRELAARESRASVVESQRDPESASTTRTSAAGSCRASAWTMACAARMCPEPNGNVITSTRGAAVALRISLPATA